MNVILKDFGGLPNYDGGGEFISREELFSGIDTDNSGKNELDSGLDVFVSNGDELAVR